MAAGNKPTGGAAKVIKVEAEEAHLVVHLVDVAGGPLGGAEAALPGGVLRRQSKGVPAHGLHRVDAAHAGEAR